MRNETRFRMVERIDPERFKSFARGAQIAAERRMTIYRHVAELRLPPREAAQRRYAVVLGDDLALDGDATRRARSAG